MPETENRSLIILPFLLFSLALPSLAGPDPARFDPLLGTDWYGVYVQGAKAGYFERSLEKIENPIEGWRSVEKMTFILTAMGRTDTMKAVDIRIYESPAGELYSSRMNLSSGMGNISVNGIREADEFIITTNIAGQKIPKVFKYPLDHLDSLAQISLYLASGKGSVGDSVKSSFYEPTPPLTGKVRQLMKIESRDTYVFNGVPADVYTVGIFLPEMKFTGKAVVDRYGKELEFTMGEGLLLKMESEANARKLDQSFDLLANNLIKPEETISDLRKLNSLKLLVNGISAEDLINNEYQKVDSTANGLLIGIARRKAPVKTADRPVKSMVVSDYLDPGPYIQSDAAEIIDLAGKIIGSEQNSWKAAGKINQWVYDNITKQFTPDISNALQTLHSRKGDCGEHAALAVALMRASGIPARSVTGLVYWPPGDGFGYHAWIEVFVGEWVMMDPSWGENLINPSHIALTTGDIVDQASILNRVMGKLKIEVLETK